MQSVKNVEQSSLLEMGLNGEIRTISFFRDFHKIGIKEDFRKYEITSIKRNSRSSKKTE